MHKLKRVLLVDDDEISNMISHRLITQLNIAENITTLNNGKEAIDYLERNMIESMPQPELIFLDINMPVMDGFEFLEEMQKDNRFKETQIKVVILTSSADPVDLNRSKKYKIDAYVNKPLSTEKLYGLILQLV